ncbi:MAG: hypothetical protein R6V83_09390 [Candidatus Thorarchaeota archaeon]
MFMIHGRKTVFAVLFISAVLFTSMAQNCFAMSDRLKVSVDHAYYYDLDGDGLEDDVLIDLICEVPEGAAPPRKSEFYLALGLPSGIEHRATIMLVGKYSELHMRILWYDSAWESGWYTIKVDVIAFGGSVFGCCTTSYEFDPPTGSGTGDPHIDVLL